MVEQIETALKGALINEAAEVLKRKPVYEMELSPDKLNQVMSGAKINSSEGGYFLRASISQMDVQINRSRGVVTGRVCIEKPIRASVDVNCAFINSEVPQRLQLSSFSMDLQARPAAKLIMRPLIEGFVGTALKDPNRVLHPVFRSLLKNRGIELAELGLQLTEKSLIVNFKGRPV